MSNYDGNNHGYGFVGGGFGGGPTDSYHGNNSYNPLAGEQATGSPQSNANAQRQSFVSSLAGMGIQTGGFSPANSDRRPRPITLQPTCACRAIPCDPTSVTTTFSAAIGTPNIRALVRRGYARGVWSAADWADVNGWFGQDWPTCGNMYGIDLTYENNNVCLDGRPFATAAKYYDSAANIAQIGEQANIPSEPPAANEQTDPANAKWLPLGVFEAIPSGAKSSNMMFQLAVNKAGIIRGNYFDPADKNVQLIEGSVDKDTQRAAWVVADKKNIIFDCALYNLTRAETPVLVHMGKDKNEQWTFVRLKQQPNGTAK